MAGRLELRLSELLFGVEVCHSLRGRSVLANEAADRRPLHHGPADPRRRRLAGRLMS